MIYWLIMGKLLSYPVLVWIVAIPLLLAAGCGQQDPQGLRFVERAEGSGAPGRDEAEAEVPTLRSSVVSSGQAGERFRVCLLPFRNSGGDPEVEDFREFLPRSVKDLLNSYRDLDATYMAESDYASLLAETGQPPSALPDAQVAEAIVERLDADLILCGDISRMADETLLVEPFAISVEGGYQVSPLEPVSIELSNFWRFPRELTDRLIGLIERRRQ